MEKLNFTPAPWRVVKTKNRVIEIQDQNYCIVAEIEFDHNYQNKLIKNYPIPITAEANAKLIAIAPELYFSLAAIIDSLEGNINPDDLPLYNEIEYAKKVLTKANY